MSCAIYDARLTQAATGAIDCIGATEVHHLLKPWDGGRGMGLKATDRNVIPLCHWHHAMLHDQHGNEDAFWKFLGQESTFGRQLALTLWMQSPHYES